MCLLSKFKGRDPLVGRMPEIRFLVNRWRDNGIKARCSDFCSSIFCQRLIIKIVYYNHINSSFTSPYDTLTPVSLCTLMKNIKRYSIVYSQKWDESNSVILQNYFILRTWKLHNTLWKSSSMTHNWPKLVSSREFAIFCFISDSVSSNQTILVSISC